MDAGVRGDSVTSRNKNYWYRNPHGEERKETVSTLTNWMGQRVSSFKRETNSVESVNKSKRFFFYFFNEVCTDYSGSSGPLLSLMIRILFLSLGNFTFCF